MEDICLICHDNINQHQYVECFACNITLHTDCEYTYRVQYNNNLCECIHCKRIGTLTCKNQNTEYLRVNNILDSTKYTKLDHTKNNEDVFTSLPLGTCVYYIEKYFKYNNKKEWRVIEGFIGNINRLDKTICTKSKPDENGREYIGVIWYKFGDALLDYYIKK